MMQIENNKVTVTGEVVKPFEKDYTKQGEAFYRAMLSSIRRSGTPDELPIVVSERIFDVTQDLTGKYVKVVGTYRSHNVPREDGGNHLDLYIFIEEIGVYDEIPDFRRDDNDVELQGFVCRQPVFRITPLGREVADVMMAINRNHGKSDYIPCICWGRNAQYVRDMATGTELKISGRLQSRNYTKKISEEVYEPRIAYEVSVHALELIPEEVECSSNDESKE